MTLNEARRLKKGDIIYHPSYMLEGTIEESLNPNHCINIRWADGKKGSVHPDGLLGVKLVKKGD
jgi:hypothetical protein